MRYLKPLVPLALMIVVAGVAKAETLSITRDHATRLDVRGAANVVIGNDRIADVTVVDSRTVYLLGKDYGSTNVVISDRDGRTLFSGDVTVTAPASSVAVYRGTDRTEVACAPNCAPGDHPGYSTGNPIADMFSAFAQAKAAPPPGGGTR